VPTGTGKRERESPKDNDDYLVDELGDPRRCWFWTIPAI
jgi:hypothetical protein